MFLALSKIFYSFSINVYHLLISIASVFNEKAKHFTKGRKKQEINTFKEQTIWFHCSSLGEFEQAKPIITWCNKHLKQPIVITFFSPSGYLYRNESPLAQAVYYLPKDSPSLAKDFIKKINPAFAIFIKYEFWYFHLAELSKQNIPHYLVSGIFRKEQLFFKFYGKLHQQMLKGFSHIFVQDENSLQLLSSHNYKNCSLAFDTRFDTVKANSELNYSNKTIEQFIAKQKCLIVGSSWLKDDQLISKCLPYLSDYKIIIAPHDVNSSRLKQLTQLFPSSSLLSNPIDIANQKVLIIDSVGQLSLLYRYATVCYIGGAFDSSVHNVLEAAVYGKPLLYGPNHLKSKEAKDLIKNNAAKEIKNKASFKEVIKLYNTTAAYNTSSKNARNYVLKRTGGTESVIKKLKSDKLI